MPGQRHAAAVIAGLAVLAPFTIGIGGAHAAVPATSVVGQTYAVCHDQYLALRTAPEPTAPDQGTLRPGDHVVVEGTYANGMLYVWAEGQLNRHGYVDDGHFC